MSSNVTESELAAEEECEGKESFHIIVLSFAYSLLAVRGKEMLVRWAWSVLFIALPTYACKFQI